MQKGLATALALTAAVLALAAAALAAQPKGEGQYAGTFANGKNYVSFYVRKGKIALANVQYACKGKSVLATTTTKFKSAAISSSGAFVIKYKTRIVSNDGQSKKVASGRATIAGRFVSPTKAKGTARVKSTKCPKRKQAYTARGPQVEG
jgi:hypothetical protein